jgi:hypothetical protein
MRGFSIRWIRSLAVVVVVVLLGSHVQAHAAERSSQYADGQITGMVLDAKARPLADHRVELRVQIFSGGLRATQTVASTMTDARGRFAFSGLAPGIFEVTALRDNTIVRTSAPIQLSAGAMDHTVTLSEAAGVSFSFEDLRGRVKPGARVRVTDTSGKETTGTVADVSPSSLALLVNGVRRELSETQVRQIVGRRGSFAGRGALIGLGAGVATGFGIVSSAGGCSSNDPECSAIMSAIVLSTGIAGTAAGAVIGWSIKKSETIFLAPVLPESARLTVSPIASKTRQGLALSISF